ncbi:MAG: AI-2E family transporter [bacterium]|nr:AI-2E family transporter [bacterium]
MKTLDNSKAGRLDKYFRLIVVFLGTLTLIALCVVLKLVQSVFMPLILAWLLAQLLAPLVNLLTRWRLSHGFAIAIVLILLIFVVYWAAVFISLSTQTLVEDLPSYKERFGTVLTDALDNLSSRFNMISNEDLNNAYRERLLDFFGSAMGMIGSLFGVITTLVSNVVIIMIILAFMLAGKPHIDDKVRRSFSSETSERVTVILNSINGKISSYLSVQFMISLFTGLLVWLVCAIVGVGSAVTWGALAFFLNFIPTIGSIIAAIPPVLLAFLQFFPNFWPAVVVAVVIVVVNQILGNVVGPKIMGDRLNLSPVAILVSVLFWGWLWGIVGALLSVLIAASIKIVCDNITWLRPIGVLMEAGGRKGKKVEPVSESP